MKNIILLVLALVVAGITFQNYTNKVVMVGTTPLADSLSESRQVVLAGGLQIPWAVAFLPDKSIIFTERPGRLRVITPTGALLVTPIATINEVKASGEGGLLGLAVHPFFNINHFIYLYYTYSNRDNITLNKVVRYVLIDNHLSDEKTILSGIPGNINHNGGRLKFGPDGFLYITTGDSLNPSLAQDTRSLAGKILRVMDDGKPVLDNPFGNEVYSYGHRNPQGLAWDSAGTLWEVEHGASAGDEINIIERGKNYGWPIIRKTETQSDLVTPVLNSEDDTWAPSGMAYLEPFLFFGGLRSNSLFRFGPNTTKFDQFLQGDFGRLRDVVLGPDGFLYITTSNMDGRAITHLDGDKIIKVDTTKLQ